VAAETAGAAAAEVWDEKVLRNMVSRRRAVWVVWQAGMERQGTYASRTDRVTIVGP
jgi:phage gp37-like protein